MDATAETNIVSVCISVQQKTIFTITSVLRGNWKKIKEWLNKSNEIFFLIRGDIFKG